MISTIIVKDINIRLTFHVLLCITQRLKHYTHIFANHQSYYKTLHIYARHQSYFKKGVHNFATIELWHRTGTSTDVGRCNSETMYLDVFLLHNASLFDQPKQKKQVRIIYQKETLYYMSKIIRYMFVPNCRLYLNQEGWHIFPLITLQLNHLT